jgi:catechol 2,3-dioxygenase-like lactoylglutathione lyase family enzyme
MERPDIDEQITFLYTRDLKETARFYEQILGLQLKLDQGTCRIYTITENSYLGFCQKPTAGGKQQTGKEHQDVIFTIVTRNVDQWYTFLNHQGILFEKPPAINPKYNIYHCFLRDPDGYLIEIQEFLDPNWK